MFNYLKKSHNDNQDVVTVVSLWTLRIYNDGQRLFNTLFYFTLEFLIYFDPFSVFVGIVLKLAPVDCVTNAFLGLLVQFQIEIRKISYCGSRSPEDVKFGHFTLLFLQRTAKKCTKNYNVRSHFFTYQTFCLVTFSLPLPSCFAQGPYIDVVKSKKHIKRHIKEA